MPEFQMDTLGNVAVIWTDLDALTRGYITAMFWTNSGDEGSELNDSHGFESLAAETLCGIIQDCAAFKEANAENLRAAYSLLMGYDEARAGEDYWLTRNGHGVGFWDRGLGAVGDALTEACQNQTREVYVGDDGLIYLT